MSVYYDLMNTSKCSVDGCEKKLKASGLCGMHHERVRRNGTTVAKKTWRPGDTECLHSGCSQVTRGGALGYCRKHYLRVKKHGSSEVVMTQFGPLNQCSGWINQWGYRVIHRDGVSILEHRWVMEQILGRPLLPSENVHHKNGERDDNRPENLELWTTMQPCGKRPEDLVAFAKEVLALYGDH